MSDKVSSFSKWWGRVYVEKIAMSVGMVLFLFGTTLAMVEVFRRYIFGVSFMWQQDIVVVSLLCGISLYFTIAQWERSHISVTAVQEYLARKKTPRRLRAIQVINGIGDAWTGIFFVLMLIWGIPLVIEYEKLGIRLQSQLTVFWPFFLVFVASLVPLVLTYFLHAFQNFRGTEVGGPDAHGSAK